VRSRRRPARRRWLFENSVVGAVLCLGLVVRVADSILAYTVIENWAPSKSAA
jgi:hypothetical protein